MRIGKLENESLEKAVRSTNFFVTFSQISKKFVDGENYFFVMSSAGNTRWDRSSIGGGMDAVILFGERKEFPYTHPYKLFSRPPYPPYSELWMFFNTRESFEMFGRYDANHIPFLDQPLDNIRKNYLQPTEVRKIIIEYKEDMLGFLWCHLVQCSFFGRRKKGKNIFIEILYLEG